MMLLKVTLNDLYFSWFLKDASKILANFPLVSLMPMRSFSSFFFQKKKNVDQI